MALTSEEGKEFEVNDIAVHFKGDEGSEDKAVSYTHLTLPTKG